MYGVYFVFSSFIYVSSLLNENSDDIISIKISVIRRKREKERENDEKNKRSAHDRPFLLNTEALPKKEKKR